MMHNDPKAELFKFVPALYCF